MKKEKDSVVSKRILKKSRLVVKIPEKKVENVLSDTNRFFKNEMEEARKSLFFS